MWKIDEPLRQPYVDKDVFDRNVDWQCWLKRSDVNRGAVCNSDHMLIQFSANSGINRPMAEEIVQKILKGLNSQ